MLAVIFWAIVVLVAMFIINVVVDLFRIKAAVKHAIATLSTDAYLVETGEIMSVKINQEAGWGIPEHFTNINKFRFPALEKMDFDQAVACQVVIFKVGTFNDVAAFLMYSNLGRLCGLRRLSLEEALATAINFPEYLDRSRNLTCILGHKSRLFHTSSGAQVGRLYFISKLHRLGFTPSINENWAIALAVR